MTAPSSVTVGDQIAWTAIHPDGGETSMAGSIWALAAPVAGMSAFWCLPGPSVQGDPPRPPALVSRAARRHLVGRAYRIRRCSVLGDLEWRDMWNPTGGRFVDKGEWFTETDPRSRFARRVPPVPTHAPPLKQVTSVAEVEMDLFFGVCEKVAAGADIDFSVDAHAAAYAADLAHNVDAR